MDAAEVEQHDVQPARTVEMVGAIAASAGPPVAAGGFLWMIGTGFEGADVAPAATLYVAGVVGTFAGPPLLLGAVHRERRVLRARGAEVPGTAGTVGWVLLGTALGSEVVMIVPGVLDQWYIPAGYHLLPVAPYAGAVVAGLVQRGVNRRAGDGLAWDEPRGPRPLLVPHLGQAPGLDLVVVF